MSSRSLDIAMLRERVGRYTMLAPIGRGGMATVYLARAEGAGGFEREVAVKLLHADDSEQDALLREARLAARIRHPNVVAVLDAGVDADGVFLVMDYIAGESLAGLRRLAERATRPIPQPISVRILSDALAGLHAAHELADEHGSTLGLVHRDFSPHNLLIGTDGVTRLSDFGIAKITQTTGQTKSGVIKGKLGYMSPEQGRGHALDRRADVWAAGVVAWELFSGRRLCDARDELQYLIQLMSVDPPLLRSVRPDLSPAIERAVASALTRDVEQRCPSAAELRARLLEACEACADPMEVGELVRDLVGPKLQQRQRRARQIERLRAKMSLLVSEQAEAEGSDDSLPTVGGSTTDAPNGDAGPLPVVAPLAPQRRGGRIAAATLLGLVVLGSIGVLAARARPAESGAASSGSAEPPASLRAPAGGPDGPEARGKAALPARRQVRVKSTVAVSELRIGSHELAFATPVTVAQVELTGAQPGDPVHAVAADGRRLTATLPENGSLFLRFPVKAPPARSSAQRPVSEAASEPPLAGNPYPR